MTVAEILRRRTVEREAALSVEAPVEASPPPPAPPPPPPPPPKRREPIAARRRAPDAPLPDLDDEEVVEPEIDEIVPLPAVPEKLPWYKFDSKSARKKREEQAAKQAAKAETRRPVGAGARRQAAQMAERPPDFEPPPFVRALPPVNDPETFSARRRRMGTFSRREKS
ncbi:MAG TPA: hypothetical protein VMD59_21965 [Acidimicrobiales bacterium]|nr:hypothetical protein [Acidimicrobiales bacterium]